MMKKLAFLLILAAQPALAASEGPFLSLRNPYFVILIAFLAVLTCVVTFLVLRSTFGLRLMAVHPALGVGVVGNYNTKSMRVNTAGPN